MKQSSLSYRYFFAASLALLTALAGCTKKDGAAQNAPQPKLEGKVISVPLRDIVKTGDPAQVYDTVSVEPLNQVVETLYQYHYYSKTTKMVPLLADGMPEYSPDRKTVKIKIKKGVMFQDDPCFVVTQGKGRELKAQDFLFGWKRLVVTRVESEGAWIFEGKVKGFGTTDKEKVKDFSDWDALSKAEFEGMKALDDYTIELKLEKPYPQLLYGLAMSFAAPVPVEAVKHYGPEFMNHPVGTGPFKVVSWQPASEIILSRNPSFRGEAFPTDLDPEYKDAAPKSGKTMPFVDHVVFRIVKEEQPRWLDFKAGHFQLLEMKKEYANEVFDSANPGQVAESFKQAGFDASGQVGLSYWYIYFNLADSVVGQNKKLRQAISAAINRKDWLHWYRSDRGEVATELTPPGMLDRCGKSGLKYGFDLDRAKKLLAEAGYPEGKGLPELKFDLRGTDSVNRQMGEFFVKSMAAIGIRAQFTTNTFPAFLTKRQKRNLQIALGGWVMDYPDAENNFQLYYGPNLPPGPNESSFANPEFDKLYQEVATMPSGAKRKELICKMEELLAEDVPALWGFYETTYWVHSKKLKGYHTNMLVWNRYKYLDVEP